MKTYQKPTNHTGQQTFNTISDQREKPDQTKTSNTRTCVRALQKIIT